MDTHQGLYIGILLRIPRYMFEIHIPDRCFSLCAFCFFQNNILNFIWNMQFVVIYAHIPVCRNFPILKEPFFFSHLTLAVSSREMFVAWPTNCYWCTCMRHMMMGAVSLSLSERKHNYRLATRTDVVVHDVCGDSSQVQYVPYCKQDTLHGAQPI